VKLHNYNDFKNMMLCSSRTYYNH